MIGRLRSTYLCVVIGLSETVYSAAITEKVMKITRREEHGVRSGGEEPTGTARRLAEIYGQSRHLLKEKNKEMLGLFEKEVERRWLTLNEGP